MRQSAWGRYRNMITLEKGAGRWQSCPICKIHMGGNSFCLPIQAKSPPFCLSHCFLPSFYSLLHAHATQITIGVCFPPIKADQWMRRGKAKDQLIIVGAQTDAPSRREIVGALEVQNGMKTGKGRKQYFLPSLPQSCGWRQSQSTSIHWRNSLNWRK